MELETAFEEDLRRWLGQVYERVEACARGEDRRAAERVVDRQNRIYIALIVILGGSVALVPWTGATGILAALLILYVGAIASATFTGLKIRRIERSTRRYEAIRRRRELAWDQRPQLGSDERAQLVRLMNLSGQAATPRGRRAFEQELSDAGRLATLAAWPALRDAAALLDEPPKDDED